MHPSSPTSPTSRSLPSHSVCGQSTHSPQSTSPTTAPSSPPKQQLLRSMHMDAATERAICTAEIAAHEASNTPCNNFNARRQADKTAAVAFCAIRGYLRRRSLSPLAWQQLLDVARDELAALEEEKTLPGNGCDGVLMFHASLSWHTINEMEVRLAVAEMEEDEMCRLLERI